jgi:hypothetical protein
MYLSKGMSANSDSETKQCALNAGMDRFIAKPFILVCQKHFQLLSYSEPSFYSFHFLLSSAYF